MLRAVKATFGFQNQTEATRKLQKFRESGAARGQPTIFCPRGVGPDPPTISAAERRGADVPGPASNSADHHSRKVVLFVLSATERD